MSNTNYGILHEVGEIPNFMPMNQKDQKAYAESLNEQKQQNSSNTDKKNK